MSYNIDSIDIIRNEGFRIRVKEARKLLHLVNEADEREYLAPESNILSDISREIKKRERTLDGETLAGDVELPIQRVRWSGEGSGSSYNMLLDTILPATLGRADLVVVWEGGDSVTGIRVIDGQVEKRKVVMTLGDLVES